jgi:pimeloyl-ACP methyl ester carboxylesterase
MSDDRDKTSSKFVEDTPHTTSPGGIRWLHHGRVDLALHPLREREGPGLLLLHGLGQRSPARVPEPVAQWPGSIHALDFTGHGRSTSRPGYYDPDLTTPNQSSR